MLRMAVLLALLPALVGAGPAAARRVPPVKTETTTLDGVRATLSTVELRRGVYYARLVVVRDGAQVFDERVQPYWAHDRWTLEPGFGGGVDALGLRDLNGDGEPEILLNFWTEGAHCCSWTRIYRWHPVAGTYTNVAHMWGDPGFRLADFDHDGKLELVTGDDRFAYEFASFAGSALPVRVWRYRDGRLVDATSAYPKLVENDAEVDWKGYLAGANAGETRGVLAAWVADECRLGRCEAAFRWVAAHRAGWTGPSHAGASWSPLPYLVHLRNFLTRAGYIRG